MLECEGNKDDTECWGEVHKYRIVGYGFDCVYTYCEAHAEADRKNGFRLTILQEPSIGKKERL
jgi:hypothetical protein